MSQFCKTRCRKCFPNGCCGFCKPPPQIQQQVATVINLQKNIVEKDVRYGYVFLYPGVRSSENSFTSPVLSVHLYRYSQQKANVAQNNRTVVVQGNTGQYTSQGPQNLISKDTATADEETIMIPIEDIISISSQLEVKKGLKADVESTVTPKYGFLPNCFDSCWNSTTACYRNTCGCCQASSKIVPLVENTLTIQNDPNRNTEYEETDLPVPSHQKGCFDPCRCCCCRKKILERLIQRKKVNKEREAQRVITMNIEYSKYSNLNTPSHTRLLSNEHQTAYYKQKFDAERKLKFYLVNNTEFDPANFELKKLEAETLTRTVVQLKGMKDHYPSERELDEVLKLNSKKTFGDLYREPTLQLPVGSTSQISQGPRPDAIKQSTAPKTTTMSEENPAEKSNDVD